MYAKELCFLCGFLHVFSAHFGTIWQNQIGFSDDIQRIFSHKLTFVGIPPCLILRKFARRGPSVLKRKYCRDLNSHSPFFSTSYHILYKSSIFFLFSITVFFKELISSSYFCMSCSSILAKSILIFNCKSCFASIRACRFPD